MITIIIPCKNEENYIGNLLNDLYLQKSISFKIYIADANSTDNTINIINSYKNKLNIKIIEGGLPAIGRNNGLNLSKTKWTLFLDSDVRIKDRRLLSYALKKASKTNCDLLTCKLKSFDFKTNLIYFFNNLIIKLSKYDNPFAVGSFMLFNTKKVKSLGGFPTNLMHCEDYFLSKQINPRKFFIINKYIYTDNRRFKKMSYLGMIKYFIKNIIERNNIEYFKKDINYWS
jgi:glycosyltransferase involved in cell wall biosynthesis